MVQPEPGVVAEEDRHSGEDAQDEDPGRPRPDRLPGERDPGRGEAHQGHTEAAALRHLADPPEVQVALGVTHGSGGLAAGCGLGAGPHGHTAVGKHARKRLDPPATGGHRLAEQA
ncbi:hypothetical protein [Salana multivorans]